MIGAAFHSNIRQKKKIKIRKNHLRNEKNEFFFLKKKLNFLRR